ncbi:MAG TPA: IS30 family transposase [Candidatus Eisenbacteria bacterium]|nr:IS30 family transposase [Candidatus Eisenbacteria bacterium]
MRRPAAAALGLEPDTGRDWFRQAGGVVPAFVTKRPSGRFLSFAEREEIFAGVERGDSIRRMARELERTPSTVLRELRRNMRQRYRRRSPGPPSARREWDYRPSRAQTRAELRGCRPKPAKLATNGALRVLVEAKLQQQLSPQQVAVELRTEFADNPEMQVSHETIYQSIYVQGRGALRRELAVHLRTGRALRRPRRNVQGRQSRIPGMVNISERPAEIEDRAVPGHWEGDLILGKNGRSAIGTLVERSTRFVMLLHLPDRHGPEEVQAAMIAATKRLPKFIWKSLTWDQGIEMRNHAQITIATGLEIYFCDPAKPWQRGSNENTNGLLRQYFPKGTDLSQHGPEYLDFVAAQMNRRPRETLGWLRPAQALGRLFSTTSEQPSVATTD